MRVAVAARAGEAYEDKTRTGGQDRRTNFIIVEEGVGAVSRRGDV